MAKLMMVSEQDPTIAVIFEVVEPTTDIPGRAQGWYGTCTDCGPAWVMHRWKQDRALSDAGHHIDVTHG